MTPIVDRSQGATGVLVFAPVGRDAALTQEFLQRASIPSVICRSITEVCDLVESGGAGALLLTEESFDDAAYSRLTALLNQQPSWSEIPVLLFAGSPGTDMTLRTIQSIESLRNVTLFERPVRLAAVLTAVRAALRARARQFEVRDLLAELREARAAAEEANRLKDQFLATLSHELRTPLNAIVGWTSMLTRGQVDPARMQRVFEALDRNAQAQAQLIADVLDVSRIVTGKLQLQVSTVDLCDLVAQATDSVRAAASAKNIELSLEETSNCVVRGDAGRLQQVVWNLLSNAIKFTSPGGSIRISVAREERRIALSVADSGAGIPSEFLPQVFDSMRRNSASGFAGFARNAEKPAARADSADRASANADNATAGIRSPTFELLRTRRMNENPSSSGIARSATRTSGARSCSACQPSAAEPATQTSAPALSKAAEMTSRVEASSSTMRIVLPSNETSAAGPCGESTGEKSDSARSAAGSRTTKQAPRPGPSLDADTVPPCNSTRCFTIDSPRPNPPCPRVLDWSA